MPLVVNKQINKRGNIFLWQWGQGIKRECDSQKWANHEEETNYKPIGEWQ